jgi:NhaA family Na+:H+ antiporter
VAAVPAERVERAVDPWSAFLVLPLFALCATGASFSVNMTSPRTLGVLAGVVVGKPLGILLASLAAVKAKIALFPEDTRLRAFVGGALLCGVRDPVALLLADLAFPKSDFAGVGKIGLLVGSLIAGAPGWLVLSTGRPRTRRATVRD